MSFAEQVMSKDKYPSIFSPQMKTNVFIILQIFYATRGFENWGIFLDMPQFLFRPITHKRKYLMDYKWSIVQPQIMNVQITYTYLCSWQQKPKHEYNLYFIIEGEPEVKKYHPFQYHQQFLLLTRTVQTLNIHS